MTTDARAARTLEAARVSPRLLSSDDAARYLGMTRPTLYTLGLRYILHGRRRRYDVRDLDAWIERQQAVQSPPNPRRPAA